MNIPNLNSLKGLARMGKAFVVANRPELLLGTSIAAAVGSTVLAAKGGYEARGIIEAEKKRREWDDETTRSGMQITPKEHVQLTWQCYLPSAFALSTTLACTTGLHLVHVKEKKALVQAGVLALEETKEIAEQYRNELIGVASPEKATEVENKIHEKRADERGVSRIMNSDGEIEELYLVRDLFSGRDIWSNQHRIEDAVIEINNVLNGSDAVELSHFYRHAGFDRTTQSGKVGWSGSLVSLDWGHTIRDDGRPVRTFRFEPEPEAGYDSDA